MEKVEAKKQVQREVNLEGEFPEVVRPTKTVRVGSHYRRPPAKRSIPSEPQEDILE